MSKSKVSFKDLFIVVNKFIETKNEKNKKDEKNEKEKKESNYVCLDAGNQIQITIPSIEPSISFKLKTNLELTKWDINYDVDYDMAHDIIVHIRVIPVIS